MMQQKKKDQIQVKTDEQQSNTDPLGMWTGVPDDPYDVPVQDADDL